MEVVIQGDAKAVITGETLMSIGKQNVKREGEVITLGKEGSGGSMNITGSGNVVAGRGMAIVSGRTGIGNLICNSGSITQTGESTIIKCNNGDTLNVGKKVIYNGHDCTKALKDAGIDMRRASLRIDPGRVLINNKDRTQLMLGRNGEAAEAEEVDEGQEISEEIGPIAAIYVKDGGSLILIDPQVQEGHLSASVENSSKLVIEKVGTMQALVLDVHNSGVVRGVDISLRHLVVDAHNSARVDGIKAEAGVINAENSAHIALKGDARMFTVSKLNSSSVMFNDVQHAGSRNKRKSASASSSSSFGVGRMKGTNVMNFF